MHIDSHHFLAHIKIDGHPIDATGETIEDLRNNLSEWLNIERHVIKFMHLNEGCIEVIFELPKTVEPTFRAKAAKQCDAWLADIISLSINDESPIYVNSTHSDHIGKHLWLILYLTKVSNLGQIHQNVDFFVR